MTDLTNLTVVDLDPLAVGTLPRYIMVESLLGEQLFALWSGEPVLIVGDTVSCRLSGSGQYLIVEGTSIPAPGTPASHTHDWGDVTGEPATFPPDLHTLLGASHSDTLAASVVAG